MQQKVLWPQLAASSNLKTIDGIFDSSDYVGERKIDGSRYLLHVGGGAVSLTSRTKSAKDGLPVNKELNVPHLIVPLYRNLKDLDYTVFDGEIQHQDFALTVSVMGSGAERAIELQKSIGNVDYHVFDIIYYKDEFVGGWPQYERRQLLESIWGQYLAGNDHIKLVKQIRENKFQAYLDYVAAGGEGMILKHINGHNIPRKSADDSHRPNDWIKVKKILTDDVVIIGSEPPERLYTGKDIDNWPYWEGDDPVTRFWYLGLIGSIKFGQYDSSGALIPLGSTSGITDELRHNLSDEGGLNSSYIGKVMEISAMEKTKAGAFRHPRFIRFRPDKDAEECRIR